MIPFVLVLIASFLLSYLATVEIIAIALGWRAAATIVAAVRSAASFLCTYLIVVEPERIMLLPAYVSGDAFGTWLALQQKKADE